MEIKMDIPEYIPEKGITYQWLDGAEIRTVIDNGKILILANRDGLISLANHMLNLAQETIPRGYHMHFDEFNSLEEGSIDLIIEKHSISV